MDMLGIIKKLKGSLIRRSFHEWGAEEGLKNFPAAGHGVFVPTYFADPDPEPAAAVVPMPQERWQEAANG